ncbi:MAG: DMT family transporter [Rhizobiales bacterium]|nr:DMT family transporter [Hyphomicrobiales bacterium]
MTVTNPASQERHTGRKTILGIGMMLLGVLIFATSDVIGKWSVASYSVAEVLLIRSLVSLLMVLPFIQGRVWRAFATSAPLHLHVFRAILSIVEVAGVYWAFRHLPLAEVQTYFLAAPIFVAAMSPFLLGERIGWRRWTAVLVGFAGVVIAMQPTGVTIGWPALAAVGSSFLYALLLITTRGLRGASDAVLLGWQAIGGIVFGIIFAPAGWVTPPPTDAALLASIGVISTLAYFCVNRSLKLAPASIVVPFQYTAIIWAAIFGLLFFGDAPRLATLAGAAIIIAAGLFIFLREQAQFRA